MTEAKARGIDVRVVVDHAQNTDDQGAIRPSIICRHKRIPVFLGAGTMRRMHHKFMVADGLACTTREL